MTEPIDLPLPGLPGMLHIRIRYAKTHDLALPDIDGSMMVLEDHLAPTGYLHAATVVALADTACGYGALASLPAGKAGFTTIELKANFLGTATVEQELTVHATAIHRGGTTQVWDATVRAGSAADDVPAVIAVFRCTQLLLDAR